MHVQTVDFQAPEAPVLFTQSLKETGFAVLNNHPIQAAEIDEMYAAWESFFASDSKHDFLYDHDNQDGFFPAEIAEVAKGNDIRDLKEFFQLYSWGQIPENLRPISLHMYTKLSNVAATLLNWLEENTPDEIKQHFSEHLSSMIQDSPRTQLRILHYPPLTGDEEAGAVRAAAHGDINLITLLVAGTAPGLQAQDSAGNWHDVSCDKGAVVVNVGDMLERASQRYYKSTIHRVLNPTGEAAKKARMSLPLFLHPRDEVYLTNTVTANDYRIERLIELGIYDKAKATA